MGSESIEAVRVSKSSNSGRFPPGFRFHPTDEELVLYYLKRKICRQSLKLDFIGEVDVYKWDPEELPGQSTLKTGDRQWFFFSPRDRKYPNGGRSSRATMHGYWKATGKDRIIKCNSRSVGIKKTLVYYQGRAPSGQRTDWVMHEYTLDEEELKRCQYAREYYALYKVFKKSGPGPKNGEQYGAPFVEEEWADDDYFDVDALLLQNIGPPKQLHPIPVDNISKEEEPISTNEIEAILNKIVDEPETAPPLTQSGLIISEEESDFFEQMMALSPYYVQPGSDLGQSKSSTYEASEVTSVTNVPIEEVQPLVVNEDFLEMDDLIGPQPAIQNSERSVGEDLQISDFENMYEFDMYHDLTRFSDMGSFGNQQIQQQLEYGIENSGLNSYTNNTGSEVVHDDHQISYDLWTHDQRNCDIVAAQSSGVVIDENLGNSDSCVNPQPKTDDGTDSWFKSALWAFVESIPTTPASASESSALVNKAFERMSSFSRIRNVNEAAAAAGGIKRSSRSSSSSRGIIYFSVLGILFAILWVFVGTSIELLARCIS